MMYVNEGFLSHLAPVSRSLEPELQPPAWFELTHFIIQEILGLHGAKSHLTRLIYVSLLTQSCKSKLNRKRGKRKKLLWGPFIKYQISHTSGHNMQIPTPGMDFCEKKYLTTCSTICSLFLKKAVKNTLFCMLFSLS